MTRIYSKIRNKNEIIRFMIIGENEYHYKISHHGCVSYYKSEHDRRKMTRIKAIDVIRAIQKTPIGVKNE